MPSGAFNSSNRVIFSDSLTAQSELWSNVVLALVEILARTACTSCNMHYKHYFPSLHCISRPGRCLRREIAVRWPNFSHSLLLIPPPDHTPHCTALHNTTLHHSALHNTTPNHTGLHHTAGRHTSTHLSTLTLHSIPLTRFLTSPADPSTLHWLECLTNTRSACFNWFWLLFQRGVLVLMKTQILYCFPKKHDFNLGSRTSGPLPLTWMIR